MAFQIPFRSLTSLKRHLLSKSGSGVQKKLLTPHVCDITTWPQVYCFLFSIKFILRSILLHLVINFIWQSPMAVSRVKEHQLFDLLVKCVLFKYTFSLFWSFGKCCLCCIQTLLQRNLFYMHTYKNCGFYPTQSQV